MPTPPSTTFTTTLLGMGNNTGIEVSDEAVAALGAGRRPPVVVEVDGYRYASTVAVMGGRNLISFAKAHREATGLAAGDTIEVRLTLEQGERTVEIPAELAAALENAGVRAAFDALSYTRRKEAARSVADAKAEATRDRRIAKVVDELR